ncbi:glycosyltransferase family 4 protein [Phocaeicola plebeius]|uniref:glycosyltransferase family 4 protein n=1 Tax=Phocaeicola plebeius TaxID=310297 RepID=UPI00195D9E36|nr:glycosyltransferase family 4 protein [Phocaeicola plebeius]MBM6845219.1 glycosyltransferase family 4 protein [Phocaeicola plebeius]
MHICFVCREYIPSLRGGGIASYIKEMAHGLCEKGHKVTVICASDDTKEESTYQDKKVEVIRLKGGDFLIPEKESTSILKKFRTFYRFFSYRRRILETILKLKDIDIIEVPEYGAEGYYLNKLPIPVITRLHTPMLLDHFYFNIQKLNKNNWHYYWQGLQEFKQMKQAKYITSCSTSLKEWSSKFLGIPSNKIQVIYNPIQTSRWVLKTNHLQNLSVKTILFAGTICDWKGCGDLAEACQMLQLNTQMPFELHLVGKTGIYAEELQKKYGRYPWFKLIGKIPREELMKRYAEADVICFPSWWENMPMVCIEAMLCGGIVIGSNSGGMSEIISNEENGFLIPPHQPKILAKTIQKAINLSEQRRQEISQNAQKRIRDDFSMDTILQQTISYYQQVINDSIKK